MSAPEVTLASCPVDVVELSALRAREPALRAAAADRGIALPACGAWAAGRACLALSLRPARWLLLSAPLAPGAAAAQWGAAAGACAAAVDLSSGLLALRLAGPAAHEALARGCLLDLAQFAPGRAAATLIAQVSTLLAALPSGMLLLTPTSTAQHLRDWLAEAGRPFGFGLEAELTLTALTGDRNL